MKYKIGDKVRIKSINWYNINKQKHGEIEFVDNDTAFIEPMSQYCGKLATITKINNLTYSIDIDNNKFFWTDEMFEDEDIITIDTSIRPILFELSLEKAKEWYKKGGELKEIALQAYSEDELYDSLPKTWEECINRLENCEYIDTYSNIKIISGRIDVHENLLSMYKDCLPSGMGKAILALDQLLVCREVYRQGWKPNWTDNTYKYCIYYEENEITIRCNKRVSIMLSFKTKEIAKEFLENFRDLIEEAKDLI